MVEIIPAGNKVLLENFARTEGPQNIYAYSIGKYEVTQALYQAVTGTNPSYFRGENLPVEQVTWYDAVYFCNELTKITMGEEKKGYRLPTEAEWAMVRIINYIEKFSVWYLILKSWLTF